MVSIVDDFNRANGGLGANYSVPVGAAVIETNRVKVAAADAGNTLVYRNDVLTVDDCTVTLVIDPNSMGSGGRPGVVLRGDGTAANYYRVVVKTGTFGGLYIYRVVGVSATLVRTVPGAGGENIDASVAHTLEVQVTGTSDARFIVKLDGVQKDDWTDTDPAAITSPGQAGWIVTGAAVDTFFDDLSIVEGNATPNVVIAEDDATVMCALGETTYNYTFNATATDPEDGDLTASITWEYRTDGGAWNAMGTGATASQALPIGVNEVRASATDSNTATGTDIATITVQAYDFGGVTPAAGGFVDGDTYTGNGVRVLITQQPTNGRVVVTEAGGAILYPDSAAVTQMTFKYRIQDQGGISNEATITCDIAEGGITCIHALDGNVGAIGITPIETVDTAADPQTFSQTLDKVAGAESYTNAAPSVVQIFSGGGVPPGDITIPASGTGRRVIMEINVPDSSPIGGDAGSSVAHSVIAMEAGGGQVLNLTVRRLDDDVRMETYGPTSSSSIILQSLQDMPSLSTSTRATLFIELATRRIGVIVNGNELFPITDLAGTVVEVAPVGDLFLYTTITDGTTPTSTPTSSSHTVSFGGATIIQLPTLTVDDSCGNDLSPAPTCAYPLDADTADVSAIPQFNGKLTPFDGNMGGSYVTVGGLGTANSFAMAPAGVSTASSATLDLGATRKVAVQFNVNAFEFSTNNGDSMTLTVGHPSEPVVHGQVVVDVGGSLTTFNLQAPDGASPIEFSEKCISIWFDGPAAQWGIGYYDANGAAQTLMIGAYTPNPGVPAISIKEQIGGSDVGLLRACSLVVDAPHITAPVPAGFTDNCGNAIS